MSDYDRDETITEIRAALKRRSDRAWSVRGGRGTSWGWITVIAPPARTQGGGMSEEDQAELTRLFDEPVHHQGVSIPAQQDYRIEYIDRANGREPSRRGVPQWD